jgi:hypothetical protein
MGINSGSYTQRLFQRGSQQPRAICIDSFRSLLYIDHKETNMITNAIEFDAKIDADWKISIPEEYREYLSSSPRVILLPKNDNDMYDLIKASENSLDFWDNEEDKVWDNV